MPDPLIYPPKFHATFAAAFAKRTEEMKREGDVEATQRAAHRGLYELALMCESLALHMRLKETHGNNSDLS